MARLTITAKKMSNCHSLLSAALNWNSISHNKFQLLTYTQSTLGLVFMLQKENA